MFGKTTDNVPGRQVHLGVYKQNDIWFFLGRSYT